MRTIEQFVYQNKVVLHALLVQFTEVGSRNLDETVQELKDQCGRGIASGGFQLREQNRGRRR